MICIGDFCPVVSCAQESSHSENETENSGDNNPEYPETEVSPLDDLRQKFNQEN